MIQSYCGLKCQECEWAAPNNCPGCLKAHGQMFFGECPVAVCCENRQHSHCGNCPEFSCEKLTGFAFDPEHGDNGQRLETLKHWRQAATVPYKVVLHNSISLDGSFTDIQVNLGLHYQIVAHYHPEVYLVGSVTAKTGILMFNPTIPAETADDFSKPVKDPALSYWVIPDTTGSLKGILHMLRRSEYCRDIIVLVSQKTPPDYLDYLSQRNYDFVEAGANQVDLNLAFQKLSRKVDVKTILADTGRTLGNILLNQNLVDELSLIIAPEILGTSANPLFNNITPKIGLTNLKCTLLDDNHLWLRYSLPRAH